MNCKDGTQLISKQMVDLLHQLDNKEFTTPLPSFNQSSIGQHFRHIFDFYICLINGNKKGTIDYCNRERNPLIEQDKNTAIAVLQNINNEVKQLDENKNISVISDFSSHIETERAVISSSIGRELMYAFDHALHHLALIKIGLLVHYPEIKVDKNLGVAPSTIKYQKKVQKEQ